MRSARGHSLRHIPALDGLRAIAVLAVMTSHISGDNLAGGWLGVDIFFVLSGFLITSILVGEWDRTGRIRLGQFYFRRLLRLYPALILLVLGGAIFAHDLGAGGTARGYLTTALLEVSYTEDLAIWITHNVQGGFGHTWSLAVEEHFYLLWPIALITLLRRNARVIVWAAAGTVISLTLLIALSGDVRIIGTPLDYYLPQTRAYELLLGCVVALLLRDHAEVFSQRWAAFLTYIGLIGALMLIVTAPTTLDPGLWDNIATCGGFAALAVLGLAVNGDSVPARLLSVPPLRYIGRISYGLYLYHYAVLEVVSDHFQLGGVKRPLVLVGLTFTLAAISYAAVERPIMRGGRRWMAERQPVPADPDPDPDADHGSSSGSDLGSSSGSGFGPLARPDSGRPQFAPIPSKNR